MRSQRAAITLGRAMRADLGRGAWLSGATRGGRRAPKQDGNRERG
jgi:hypothetical protein